MAVLLTKFLCAELLTAINFSIAYQKTNDQTNKPKGLKKKNP